MRTQSRIPLFMTALILMVPITLPGGSGQVQEEISADRLSPKLSLDLAQPSNDGRSVIKLIIQFKGDLDGSEKLFLEGLGFSISRSFHVVPALSVRGPVSMIDRILENPDVIYVEHNDPVISDMEMGTSVINATQVWSTMIQGPGWSRDPIDGKGVTVCVVDTGIDAGHPDLDYGTKTIKNVFDMGGGNWVEMENSDTNYGHGTHVAGTVAGNGDASAGARRGVAPGANLIGITVSLPAEGSTPTEDGYIQGLEWVYDHSRPGANPDNIRVVTNSWHSTVEEYDPQAMLINVIEALTFENNVVSTWSAGNDGRDDPEGEELTTSGQGNTPVAIMVAAYERDGSAVTDFSSRGKVGLNHTYPDIGAPGRSIWSTSARRTVISAGTWIGGNTNPYYLAISGTSMSTPHVAGLIALLWQACPSMDISPMHEDYSGPDPEAWFTDPQTRIHDAEWIIEASANFLPPDADHGNVAGDVNSTGWWGKPVDYVQGYGIVDAKRAVGIALTLQRLRDQCIRKDVSVADAIHIYDKQDVACTEFIGTVGIVTGWTGEYSRYNDQTGNPISLVNQTKLVEVPQGATHACVRLSFSGLDLSEFKAADLAFTIDTDGDGNVDHQSDLSLVGSNDDTAEIDISGPGIWTFDIIGRGLKIQRPFHGTNYVELRMEYTMSVEFQVPEEGENPVSVRNAVYAPLMPGDDVEGGYQLEMMQYNLRELKLEEGGGEEVEDEGGVSWALVFIISIILALAGVIYYIYRKGKDRRSTK